MERFVPHHREDWPTALVLGGRIFKLLYRIEEVDKYQTPTIEVYAEVSDGQHARAASRDLHVALVELARVIRDRLGLELNEFSITWPMEPNKQTVKAL